jgi:Reverse transcriptase (RNA-dependent DNA polymerase)
MDKPCYKNSPIRSVQALSQSLGISAPLLESLAVRASSLYTEPKPKIKKNGGIRYVYDTHEPLKGLLKKINRVIFEKTYFPYYLTGSLKGKDFIANVDIHKGARGAITEDISRFFDNITATHVKNIWLNFFHFSEEVAELLTKLTTRDDRVFQGTPTSSYLANLAFWSTEPLLVAAIEKRGLRYSRYVDDVAVSSLQFMTKEDRQWVIAQIYGMFKRHGFRPDRKKHQSFSAKAPITLMGLNATAKARATITQKERAAIRTQLFQLEKEVENKPSLQTVGPRINRVSGKIARLNRLHPTEGQKLRDRLNIVRRSVNDSKMPV